MAIARGMAILLLKTRYPQTWNVWFSLEHDIL